MKMFHSLGCALHRNVWWRVLAELLSSQNELVFVEISQVFVGHHTVLDQRRSKLLQNLAEKEQEQTDRSTDNI